MAARKKSENLYYFKFACNNIKWLQGINFQISTFDEIIKVDGFEKSPISALRCIPRHCDVR